MHARAVRECSVQKIAAVFLAPRKMDDRAPQAKMAKRSTLVSLTAEERIKQYPVDFYADGGVLFCRFCEHSIDFTHLDTVKNHIKSFIKRSSRKREWKEGASSSKQLALSICIKSEDLRERFVLDYIKMCTVADIPLEKTESTRPFLQKHYKQVGALPQVATLHYLCSST